jgi:hypothetical protein
MRRLLTLAALVLCAPALAADALVIRDDPGGALTEYASHYRAIARSGEHVVIDGDCISACTMIFGRVPANRVCVTPNAVFGFHSASYGAVDENRQPIPGEQRFTLAGTRELTARYPAAVRAAIRRRGWNMASAHPQVIFIPAAELGVYGAC